MIKKLLYEFMGAWLKITKSRYKLTVLLNYVKETWHSFGSHKVRNRKGMLFMIL